MMTDIPNTHRYLIEPISNSLHPMTILASSYVSFYKSLVSSKKLTVRILARLLETDHRTVLGMTLNKLCNMMNMTDISLLSSCGINKRLKYFAVPDQEIWRIESMNELLKLRTHSLSLPGFTKDEVNLMLVNICTS